MCTMGFLPSEHINICTVRRRKPQLLQVGKSPAETKVGKKLHIVPPYETNMNFDPCITQAIMLDPILVVIIVTASTTKKKKAAVYIARLLLGVTCSILHNRRIAINARGWYPLSMLDFSSFNFENSYSP